MTTLAQVQEVNARVNQFPYIPDPTLYGTFDRMEDINWSQKLAGMVGGDCEDFGITKYHELRKIGVPAKDMKLAIGWAINPAGLREGHGWLVVAINGEDYILDSRPNLQFATRHEEVHDLQPLGFWNFADNEYYLTADAKVFTA